MYGSSRIQQINQGSAQTLIRGGACVLSAVRGFSDNTGSASTQAYIQIWDAATAKEITVGATSPNWVVACVSSNVSDGDCLPTMGVMIRDGIVIACTQRIGQSNSTSSNLNVEICIV